LFLRLGRHHIRETASCARPGDAVALRASQPVENTLADSPAISGLKVTINGGDSPEHYLVALLTLIFL